MQRGRLTPCLILLSLALFSIQASWGQETVAAPAPQVAPKILTDIDYGEANEPAQRLDVYLAASDTPVPAMVYIHGGGWRAGSKSNIPGFLMAAVKEGWLSVVSVEYRFTDVAPHPAQVNDCLLAMQTVRHRAAEWNIDPQRIGVCGGSAGAHLSLCVALRDDIAAPEAEDPVRRESSRVNFALEFAGPSDWTLLGELEHLHPAYRQILGYEPGTPYDQMAPEKVKDVSPITFATKDDPPIVLYHGSADSIVPHRHAEVLHERLQSAGVSSELITIDGANHEIAGAGHPTVATHATAFMKKQFLEKKAP